MHYFERTMQLLSFFDIKTFSLIQNTEHCLVGTAGNHLDPLETRSKNIKKFSQTFVKTPSMVIQSVLLIFLQQLQGEEAQDVRQHRQLLRLARRRPRADRLHRRHLYGHRRKWRRHLLILDTQFAVQVKGRSDQLQSASNM